MRIEERLRDAFSRQVADARPSEDAWASIQKRLGGHSGRGPIARILVAAFALVLSTGALIGLWAAFQSDTDVPSLGGPSREPVVADTIRVGGFPRTVAFDEAAVWVSVQADKGSFVARIDPHVNRVIATIPVQVAPDHLAVAAGAVWGTVEGIGGEILRIDPHTNRVVETISIGRGSYAQDLAGDQDGVWVGVVSDDGGSSSIARIDPATNEIVATVPLDRYFIDVAVGAGSVWVLDSKVVNDTIVGDGQVIRIDPSTNQVVSTIQAAAAGRLAVAGNDVWVQSWLSSYSDVGTGADDRIVAVHIDTQTNQVSGELVTLDHGFIPVAADETSVWFLSENSSGDGFAISRLSAETSRVDESVVLETEPVDAVLDGNTGTIWVAQHRGFVTRIDLR